MKVYLIKRSDGKYYGTARNSSREMWLEIPNSRCFFNKAAAIWHSTSIINKGICQEGEIEIVVGNIENIKTWRKC